jgi:hypothetical protein
LTKKEKQKKDPLQTAKPELQMHLQRTDSLPPLRQTDCCHNGRPSPNLLDFTVSKEQVTKADFPEARTLAQTQQNRSSPPATHNTTANPIKALERSSTSLQQRNGSTRSPVPGNNPEVNNKPPHSLDTQPKKPRNNANETLRHKQAVEAAADQNGATSATQLLKAATKLQAQQQGSRCQGGKRKATETAKSRVKKTTTFIPPRGIVHPPTTNIHLFRRNSSCQIRTVIHPVVSLPSSPITSLIPRQASHVVISRYPPQYYEGITPVSPIYQSKWM